MRLCLASICQEFCEISLDEVTNDAFECSVLNYYLRRFYNKNRA